MVVFDTTGRDPTRSSIDVAAAMGVSQQTVSRIERGAFECLSLAAVRSAFAAVGAEYRGEVRWRGAEVERLLDDAHAALSGTVAELLSEMSWTVAVEVTFSRYGERGSIDLLAWHEARAALLVVEVKTSLTSAEAMLRRLDVKARLRPVLARELWGIVVADASRLVVLTDTRTERRCVARHEALLRTALPVQGRAAMAWCRTPIGALRGLKFVTSTLRSGASPKREGRHRVDVARAARPRV